jgi:hypothetical protein
MIRVFLYLWLLLILAACTVPSQATDEGAVSTQTPRRLLAQPTVDSAFESSVLLSVRNAEAQHYEIRLVNPTTGEAAPGYPPLILASPEFVESETFSADGKRLAAVGSNDRRSEGYAGGVRYWPSADRLYLIDLPTWRAMTLPLPGKGWVGPLAFSPKAAYLALVYHDALVYHGRKFSNLMLFDTGSGKLVAERTLEFRPTLLAYTQDGTTLVVYGQPLGSPPGMGKPDSPHLLLAEATTLDVIWDQPLEDIVSGEWCLEKCNEPHGAQVFAEWRPAVVPAHDGHKLYIVHADAERLTTVDLDARTIQTVEVQAARSWFERLLALTAGVAKAKGVYTGTTKEAVLSPDGGHLYVISRTSNARHDADGNEEEIETQLGLQVIDVERGREVASRDLEMTGTWLSADRIGFTPDNAYLLASGWRDGKRWTEVLDAKSLARVARLEGWEVVPTRRLGGQPILLARRWPGEKQTEFEFAVLDPQSFDVVDSWLESNASWMAP